MSKSHTTLSRRDFAKLAGLGSIAAATAATGTFVWAKEDGSGPASYTGWESSQGKEYWDRKPFEVDEVTDWSWKVVGPDLGGDKSTNGIHRFDCRTGYTIRHASTFTPTLKQPDSLPDVWPSSGLASLDPYWQEYYTRYPAMLERDKQFKYEWYPTTGKPWAQSVAAEGAKWDASTGYLANVYSDVSSVPSYPDVNTTPDKSDWAGVNKTRAIFESPEHASKFIKELAYEVGATLVRISKTNPAWVLRSYWPTGFPAASMRGWPQGEAVQMPGWWDYTISVTPTMNWDSLYGDPNFGNSSVGYEHSAHMSWQIQAALKRMGYPARAHWPGACYDLIAPPVAAEGGMGQIGRTSNCIAPDLGGNFRVSHITTSLPMAVDKPVDFKLDAFCSKCKLCAEVCPTQAISYADSPDFEIRGLRRFYTDHKKCRTSWMIDKGPAGCRACVAICPWTKKNSWLHRFVRETVPRDPTGVGVQVALWAERNFYHKNFAEDLVLPNKPIGVYAPPEWLKTENYVSGFTETPMGVK